MEDDKIILKFIFGCLLIIAFTILSIMYMNYKYQPPYDIQIYEQRILIANNRIRELEGHVQRVEKQVLHERRLRNTFCE